MRSSHSPQRMSATFDEPNLISAAGLVPMVELAGQVGLPRLIGEHVRLPGPAGANPSAKVMTLVAGMAAGADSIDDMGLLRHAGMGHVFTAVRAPSTLGTFLRRFTFGHVRQLDAVASRTLIGLAGRTALLPGIATDARIDIDDTIKDVFAPGQAGRPVRVHQGPRAQRPAGHHQHPRRRPGDRRGPAAPRGGTIGSGGGADDPGCDHHRPPLLRRAGRSWSAPTPPTARRRWWPRSSGRTPGSPWPSP